MRRPGALLERVVPGDRRKAADMMLLEPGFDLPPVLSDPNERRLTVRVLQAWSVLRRGADCPQVASLVPQVLGPSAANCVLIHLLPLGARRSEWIGENLCGEAGLPESELLSADAVPGTSMLGCLLEHAGACVELGAPLDIESEAQSIRGCEILYRGTLLPLAAPDGSITSVLGAISWKECAPVFLQEQLFAALSGHGLRSAD